QISYSLTGTAGANGWFTSNVDVDWTVTDPESAVTVDSGCVDQTISTETTGTTLSCSAHSTGGSASDSVTVKLDKTGPSAALAVTAGTAGANGWFTSNVTVGTSGSDGISGPVTCTADQFQTTETAGETFNGSCTNDAGLSTNAASLTVKLDKTAPTDLAFTGGGLSDGGSYYFGSVPAGPTGCTADGAISGLDSCSVSGYSTAVGSHTVQATATDNAGNVATKDLSYNVLAWTISGFYAPVDRPDTFNVTKNGSTVPLKFEVFAGTTELTDISVVDTFTQKVSCASGAGDAIEEYTTGSTSLRYDTTTGQFIFNWKTPKQAGACYRVTMTTADGSSIYANFNLK
ncbi:MAG TPA: PxKF domain-containing protein, partial [Actinomycetota bacterium]|nr:PxKF domain-containing protein [Actinomycetota bacterium]